MTQIYEIKNNNFLTEEGLSSFLISEGEYIKTKLSQYGAVLFKEVYQEIEKLPFLFDQLFPELPAFNSNLPGVFTSRPFIKKNVQSSTYLNARLPMALHNEFNYLSVHPRYICFSPIIVPNKGGETLLVDGREVLKQLPLSIKERFDRYGVLYKRNLYSRRLLSRLANKFVKVDESWQEVFQTTDKNIVEKKCREVGLEWSWKKKDWLELTIKLPGIKVHPETKERSWFNQGAYWTNGASSLGLMKYCLFRALYFNKETRPIETFYGNGSFIDSKDARLIIETIERNTFSQKLKIGDILLIDNFLLAHSRNCYRGERLIASIMR